MFSRHLAIGFCVLMLGDAALFAAPPSAPDLASAPERQGVQISGIRPPAPQVSLGPIPTARQRTSP